MRTRCKRFEINRIPVPVNVGYCATINSKLDRIMAITRHHTNARMSQCVIHGDTIYLSGQVANDRDADISTQTQQVLDKIDELLGEAGSDKTRILTAQVWVASIGYFAEMNKVWDAWVPEGHAPARACIEARLAAPELLVEVGVIAAK